jgi:hypothetical protein
MEKDTKNLPLQERLAIIDRGCPFIAFTGSSRLISTLRRMKMQEELEIPYEFRFSNAISVETSLRPYQMVKEEWNKFYEQLVGQLKRDYPESWEKMFGDASL